MIIGTGTYFFLVHIREGTFSTYFYIEFSTACHHHHAEQIHYVPFLGVRKQEPSLGARRQVPSLGVRQPL